MKTNDEMWEKGYWDGYGKLQAKYPYDDSYMAGFRVGKRDYAQEKI